MIGGSLSLIRKIGNRRSKIWGLKNFICSHQGPARLRVSLRRVRGAALDQGPNRVAKTKDGYTLRRNPSPACT
jgi:hypothetical protein